MLESLVLIMVFLGGQSHNVSSHGSSSCLTGSTDQVVHNIHPHSCYSGKHSVSYFSPICLLILHRNILSVLHSSGSDIFERILSGILKMIYLRV